MKHTSSIRSSCAVEIKQPGLANGECRITASPRKTNIVSGKIAGDATGYLGVFSATVSREIGKQQDGRVGFKEHTDVAPSADIASGIGKLDFGPKVGRLGLGVGGSVGLTATGDVSLRKGLSKLIDFFFNDEQQLMEPTEEDEEPGQPPNK